MRSCDSSETGKHPALRSVFPSPGDPRPAGEAHLTIDLNRIHIPGIQKTTACDIRKLGFRAYDNRNYIDLTMDLPPGWDLFRPRRTEGSPHGRSRHGQPDSSVPRHYLYVMDPDDNRRGKISLDPQDGGLQLNFRTHFYLDHEATPGRRDGREKIQFFLKWGNQHRTNLGPTFLSSSRTPDSGQRLEHMEAQLGLLMDAQFPRWRNPRAYWTHDAEHLREEIRTFSQYAGGHITDWSAKSETCPEKNCRVLPDRERRTLSESFKGKDRRKDPRPGPSSGRILRAHQVDEFFDPDSDCPDFQF